MSAQQGVPDDADPASAETTVADKDPIPPWKAELDVVFKKAMSELKEEIDALPDGEGALDTYRRKRLLDEVTTDEDTTEEEFRAPYDDLRCCFQPPMTGPSVLFSTNPYASTRPKKSSKTAKTTPKSAKGPKTTSGSKARVQEMLALPPDCLAVPLPASRSSTPPPVQLGIDLDIVVAAYAETQVAYNIYCDGLRTRLETLLPHVNSVSFHVLTDQGTLHKFPEFGAYGLGAFTTWVPGAGMGHEGGNRLASFRLMYAGMLAEAYTHNDVKRPSMVPPTVNWVSTGARRVVLVQDADETPGAQMVGLIAHGLQEHLSMCFLGTPIAANYHTPLIAQMLFFPPKCALLQHHERLQTHYGQLYAALVGCMSQTLEVKAACTGYAEDEVMMIQVLQSLLMDLKEYRIGLASVRWPHDESVTYVLAQCAVEHDFTQKPETACFITTWRN